MDILSFTSTCSLSRAMRVGDGRIFVCPNTHICLAFYPTRLGSEKEKAEAFCLTCFTSDVLVPI